MTYSDSAGTVSRVSRNGMKVYFCGSIRGGRDDVHVYRRIVHALQSYGTVLTEHVSSAELSDRGQRSHTENSYGHMNKGRTICH